MLELSQVMASILSMTWIPKKFYRVLISVFIIIILLLTGNLIKGKLNRYQDVYTKPPSLLLNSGLSQRTAAKVEIVFWFPRQPEATFYKSLPDGWGWQKQKLTTGTVDVATVSGTRVINQLEETQLLSLYENLSKLAAKQGGQAFLDERVADNIDINRFFQAVNAEPLEWALSGETYSLAGFLKELMSPVSSGRNNLNLQLLTRSTGDRSESVLAIPVLLNEF